MTTYRLVTLLIALCCLTACNNGNQPSTSYAQTVKKYTQATTLEGFVSDSHGRVRSGRVKVTDTAYQSIAMADIQNNGQYRVEISANTVLPIVLNFHAEANQANAEQLITAVIDPNISKYDINPLTTAIANKAKAMGGYTRANLIIAAEETVSVPDTNKTTEGFRGDPTTQYGGWH